VTRTSRALLALSALAGLVLGCAPATTVRFRRQLLGGTKDGELSAVVSPPSARCADGTLAVHEWEHTFVGDLDSSGVPGELTQLDRDFGLARTDGASFVDDAGVEHREVFEVFGDPEVVRLPDGRLLFARLAWRGWPFERLDGGQTFRSWQEYEAALSQAKGTGAEADFARWKIENRQRSETLFYVSEDCGRTWQFHSFLDAKTAGEGFCGEPRRGKEVALAGGGTDNKYWPGGWDRHELHVDPWTGTAWTSMNCKTGTNESKQERIFRLPPGATQWELLPQVFTREGESGAPGYVPLVMTTTANGALWVFTCSRFEVGGVDRHPFVYRSDDGGDTFAAIDLADPFLDQATHERLADPVAAAAAPPCATVNRDVKLAGGANLLTHDASIARAGSDGVRVAYVSADGDPQTDPTSVQTAYVFHKGSESSTAALNVLRGPRIAAADSGGWAVNPSFIEYDQTVAAEAPSVATTLLYWLESHPANHSLRVRARVSRQALVYEEAIELDDWFAPPATGYTPGDFMNGGAYCFPGDGEVHFMPVWTSWAPGEGYMITVADIDVDRPCH
jgi:hypothetical protein